jgi:integrase
MSVTWTWRTASSRCASVGGTVRSPVRRATNPGYFVCHLSLSNVLRFYVEGRNADERLFLTKRGKRLHPDNFVKRQLKPILKKLGLDGALHAFRHGNATLLDSLHAPMKVRQERLGHASAETTMGYTHFISEDDRNSRRTWQIVCSSPGKTRTA